MLAILDYDAGNIQSVRLALEHVGGRPEFVRDAKAASGAERLVFPGVGSARQCMDNLRQRGFDGTLRQALAAGTPILAICIGMQLLFDHSEEDGGVEALGLLPGTVRRFVPPAGKTRYKVPHMGWNRVDLPHRHPVLPDGDGGDFYFVHSYHAVPSFGPDGEQPAAGSTKPAVYGYTDYAGIRFASLVGQGSLIAAQFHPEKSGETGLELLSRFLQWDGKPC